MKGGDLIDPGESAGTYTAVSSYRPGWTTAFVHSKQEIVGLPVYLGELPEEVRDEILFLHRWENRLTSVPIIGPRFSADAGREVIAENWRVGIQTLIAHGWLLKNSHYVGELLQALKDPSQVDLGASIRSEPMTGMEAVLDKIVRLAF